ncbi:hypothetical protein CYMTET_20785 [Cymbomonas tetramitiformis]|uniref:Uncharacterized protein n=1 Tax=Cymbomonas tetramitiformis TaxID=36881 RepID=A0AAE0G3D7_9CHLO|nr:hypothetical protein CYMTET_20785 [Cymbomonas tetramitiformis]
MSSQLSHKSILLRKPKKICIFKFGYGSCFNPFAMLCFIRWICRAGKGLPYPITFNPLNACKAEGFYSKGIACRPSITPENQTGSRYDESQEALIFQSFFHQALCTQVCNDGVFVCTLASDDPTNTNATAPRGTGERKGVCKF